MFAHVHLCNLNMWSIILACSRKIEAVLLAASVSFLSPAMLNPSRNSDRNKTSTCYKAIIQFWRYSIANQGKSNIDKNTCKLWIFIRSCWRNFECCFEGFVPALNCILGSGSTCTCFFFVRRKIAVSHCNYIYVVQWLSCITAVMTTDWTLGIVCVCVCVCACGGSGNGEFEPKWRMPTL